MYPELKMSPILWTVAAWEIAPVFTLLAASNRSFPLPRFGLVVSFGSTPTKTGTSVWVQSPVSSVLGDYLSDGSILPVPSQQQGKPSPQQGNLAGRCSVVPP